MAGELAVVLSGGGARGAFQVGVLDELVVRRGVRIDVFAGVSTGAIQALAGAQDDVPGLVDAWLSLRGNRDVYRDRGGIVGGLLGNDSLYDASPIRARIRAFADERKLRATGKKLRLGVVNLTTGAYQPVAENTPGIANWVYASSAMPVFFRPLTTRAADGSEEQWVDGGVRDVTPLSTALELRPRAVIVVAASPLVPAPTRARRYGSLVSVGLRAVSILQSEVVANDTANASLINDLLGAREAQEAALLRARVSEGTRRAVLEPLDRELSRYRFAPVRIIAPETEVAETLEFDPARIRAGIDAGRRAAAAAWPSIASFTREF
jgi:NTE family protein